ncbi:melanoregulin-like [Anolis sagrei]|uniref:melanoregulin-like n=1 Tax=Anolis sagrei TaxID=38937 RepID=UPI00295C0ED3|nr:melanoregulin-like [Anolis sagrei ordinatus]
MDFWCRVCCCCCYNEEELEKNPLVVAGDTLQYISNLQKKRKAEAENLWNEPVDSTHMERDDDRQLFTMLQKRSKLRRGSEGYRRLSVDIIAQRQIRQKVKDRWKHVLNALGFKNEADGLLTVTSGTSYESLRKPQEARKLLGALAEQTTIFGRNRGAGPPERYLFVLDRLLLLDTGDDFLSAARHFYPVEEEEEDDSSSSDGGPPPPGPVLVKLGSEAQEEEEAEVEEEETEDADLDVDLE